MAKISKIHSVGQKTLIPELVRERTFYKYKPLCKPSARFEDPTWELMYISYGITLKEFFYFLNYTKINQN